MRWLAMYIRSVFCKHDWEKEETQCLVTREIANEFPYTGQETTITVVSATCKKCGWHRSYPKY